MMFTEDNGVGSSGHAYHNKKLSVLSIALVFISILVFQLSALVNALMPCWGGQEFGCSAISTNWEKTCYVCIKQAMIVDQLEK